MHYNVSFRNKNLKHFGGRGIFYKKIYHKKGLNISIAGFPTEKLRCLYVPGRRRPSYKTLITMIHWKPRIE